MSFWVEQCVQKERGLARTLGEVLSLPEYELLPRKRSLEMASSLGSGTSGVRSTPMAKSSLAVEKLASIHDNHVPTTYLHSQAHQRISVCSWLPVGALGPHPGGTMGK